MVLGGENLHFSTLLVCFFASLFVPKFVSSSPSLPSPPHFTACNQINFSWIAPNSRPLARATAPLPTSWDTCLPLDLSHPERLTPTGISDALPLEIDPRTL